VAIGAQNVGIRRKTGRMLPRSRYLDVMTVSASHGSTLNKESHQMLFVEPVILPNMSHLKVDKATEASESCLFYPSGQKSVQMRSEIDAAVRNINSEAAIMEAMMSTTRPRTMRETIIVPNRVPPRASISSQSTANPATKSSKSGSRSGKLGATSSKTLIFPAGDTRGYDPAQAKAEAAKVADQRGKVAEPLFQGKKTSKEMKDLFKKIRENESKIVSTVKTRI
jgi:hypothetical protein